MTSIRRILFLSLAILFAFSTVASALYCSNCGAAANGNFCSNCGAPIGSGDNANTPYDMGIPDLNGAVYGKETMNMVVVWVQTQLKATGIYYQGDRWDITGSLGDQTMQEIKSFMQARGYRNHSGVINQAVIDELASYLGYNVVPVYVGGYYDKMDSIMYGGSSGSMDKIYSNLRDMVPRTTTGARWVQICLSTLGYYNGPIDGKYGEATDRAVKAFQADYGFEPRDYVTLGVARAMIEACYSRGYTLNNLP